MVYERAVGKLMRRVGSLRLRRCGAGCAIGMIGWQLSTGAFRSTDAVQRMRQITATILARDGVRGMYLGLGPSVLQVRA
jgi:hypothetical protein